MGCLLDQPEPSIKESNLFGPFKKLALNCSLSIPTLPREIRLENKESITLLKLLGTSFLIQTGVRKKCVNYGASKALIIYLRIRHYQKRLLVSLGIQRVTGIHPASRT